jgi:hypothetical protein
MTMEAQLAACFDRFRAAVGRASGGEDAHQAARYLAERARSLWEAGLMGEADYDRFCRRRDEMRAAGKDQRDQLVAAFDWYRNEARALDRAYRGTVDYARTMRLELLEVSRYLNDAAIRLERAAEASRAA